MPIGIMPALRVEIFQWKCYTMIDWHPQVQALQALLPAYWHTTLTAFYLDSEDTLDPRFQQFQRTITALYAAILACLPLDDMTSLQLCSPPWRKSWNYGVSQPWLGFAESLQAMSELAGCQNEGWRLRARREVHISW